MRQDQRRRAQNLRTKRTLRTAVKAFETKPSFDLLRAAQSAIDTAVKKNVLTKAAAARRMSHLSAKAKKAGVKIVAKKTAAKPAATKTTAKTAAKTVPKKPAAKKPAAKKTATAKKPAPKKTTK